MAFSFRVNDLSEWDVYQHVMIHASFEYRQRVRLMAAELYEQGLSNAEVARRLGVSKPTASKWYQRWEKEGKDNLKIGTPGRKSRVSEEQWQMVLQALLEGPSAHGYDTELWTLSRIGEVIEKITGVRYNSNYVWELLGKLRWSCQKPEARAKERNETAIADWTNVCWPQIKRGPKRVAQR